MMIILPRIICERFLAQLPARPREIERMFQKMLGRDVVVDFVQIIFHYSIPCFTSHRFTQIFTDAKTESHSSVVHLCRIRGSGFRLPAKFTANKNIYVLRLFTRCAGISPSCLVLMIVFFALTRFQTRE